MVHKSKQGRKKPICALPAPSQRSAQLRWLQMRDDCGALSSHSPGHGEPTLQPTPSRGWVLRVLPMDRGYRGEQGGFGTEEVGKSLPVSSPPAVS